MTGMSIAAAHTTQQQWIMTDTSLPTHCSIFNVQWQDNVFIAICQILMQLHSFIIGCQVSISLVLIFLILNTPGFCHSVLAFHHCRNGWHSAMGSMLDLYFLFWPCGIISYFWNKCRTFGSNVKREINEKKLGHLVNTVIHWWYSDILA